MRPTGPERPWERECRPEPSRATIVGSHRSRASHSSQAVPWSIRPIPFSLSFTDPKCGTLWGKSDGRNLGARSSACSFRLQRQCAASVCSVSAASVCSVSAASVQRQCAASVRSVSARTASERSPCAVAGGLMRLLHDSHGSSAGRAAWITPAPLPAHAELRTWNPRNVERGTRKGEVRSANRRDERREGIQIGSSLPVACAAPWRGTGPAGGRNARPSMGRRHAASAAPQRGLRTQNGDTHGMRL